jgi:hypothetical protein
LNRILWWLAETASGTLHRPDQPLEQLYFQSPLELILPFDFEEKVQDSDYKLVAEVRHQRGATPITLVGAMRPLKTVANDTIEFPCIALSLRSSPHHFLGSICK